MSVIPTALRKICPTCNALYSYDEAHSCTEGNSKLLIDDLPAVDPESLIGATLGERYHIQGYLEGGGMGAVLRATHVTLLRPVAIKILVMREYQDTAAQQRFFQEAILASRVRHPNVIDIYDFGVLEGGHLYLVMEFLEGRTLRQALRDGPMTPLRACVVGCQIARGLQSVHDEGIVHRDLKPDNIFLLQRDGHPDFVKIVDFGIAKARGGPNLTQSGMLLGTPLYMAPEQISGGASDHRVDQYSLGCVLYRMLTATLPFDSPDTAELLSMHVRAPVHLPRERRPDLPIPASLEAVVLRLLAKKPDDRYPTMREVAEALACEIERLQDRSESTRLQVVSAVSGVMPKASGIMPTVSVSGVMPTVSGPLPKVSGAMPIVPAPRSASGPLPRVTGATPIAASLLLDPGEPSSETRLLAAPVLPARADWRRLIVPVALGIGAGGVILFLLVALGGRAPQALTIDPVEASRYTPPAEPVAALPASSTAAALGTGEGAAATRSAPEPANAGPDLGRTAADPGGDDQAPAALASATKEASSVEPHATGDAATGPAPAASPGPRPATATSPVPAAVSAPATAPSLAAVKDPKPLLVAMPGSATPATTAVSAAPPSSTSPAPPSSTSPAPRPSAAAGPSAAPRPAAARPRPAELTVRFEIRNSGVAALVSCAGRPPVRCEGHCVVPLPDGAGECIASAPGSGFRPESFPLTALRALPRDGKGPPAQPVTLRYIRP